MGSPIMSRVPPSGGSLEIGNRTNRPASSQLTFVPPSGGSLEIGNWGTSLLRRLVHRPVPPSGGSLEIGNSSRTPV